MLFCAPALLGFVTGLVDRGQLKAALMKAALGGSTRVVIDEWTGEYVTEFLTHGAFAGALTAIAAHAATASAERHAKESNLDDAFVGGAVSFARASSSGSEINSA